MDQRDFSSIIHSPSFTFLVGPKHTKLTIQSGLAQHVSKPLHNLMNNGHTRESRHRIAVLEDEDVETFVAFCEYAYTGDYKVPRLPGSVPVPTPAPAPAVSPLEDTRTRAVESVTSPGPSWRGTYRSDSVSSAVPPPAPSPPPESETDAQTVKVEGEVPSVVEEDVSTEAKAGVEADAEAMPGEDAGPEEPTGPAEPEAQEPPADEAQPLPGTDEAIEPAEPVEEPSTADWIQYHSLEDAPADNGAQAAPETAEGAGSPIFEGSSAYLSKKSKKPKKVMRRKKKKSQTMPLEEEPPASLTPPSTPPPQDSEVVEAQDEPAPEPEPEPVEAEDIEPEPVAEEDNAPAEPEEPEAGEKAEAPMGETPASFLPSPAPSPSAIPYDGPEWAQPDCLTTKAKDNAKDEDETPERKSSTSWDNSPPASQTIQEPSSPKPIIDMSFAKQQSDSSSRTPGLSLWDEFAALQYNDDSAVPSTPKHPTNSSPAAATKLPYLTFHAKVYVFATRYLIPALAQLCLRKLHTDLVHLPLGDGNIEKGQAQVQAQDSAEDDTDADANLPTRPGLPGAPAMVLDVLRYAYTKTTRLEPINPTSATQLRENELRRLVVHYAACRVKELARWHGGGSGSATPAVRGVGVGVGVDGMKPDSLRALLDGTPELASDLVYRMM